jgi:hypothetical protein
MRLRFGNIFNIVNLYDSLMYELIDGKEVIIDNEHGLDIIFVPDQLLMFNMLSPSDEDNDIFQ